MKEEEGEREKGGDEGGEEEEREGVSGTWRAGGERECGRWRRRRRRSVGSSLSYHQAIYDTEEEAVNRIKFLAKYYLLFLAEYYFYFQPTFTVF